MRKITIEWLRENKPEFLAKIENMKGSVDSVFIDGIALCAKYPYDSIEDRVISCISMCESLACYGGDTEKYLYNNDYYKMDKSACEHFLNMVKSKIKRIRYCVVTDSEGGAYNSIEWKN